MWIDPRFYESAPPQELDEPAPPLPPAERKS
jgi:hypothetical protein